MKQLQRWDWQLHSPFALPVFGEGVVDITAAIGPDGPDAARREGYHPIQIIETRAGARAAGNFQAVLFQCSMSVW